VFAGAQRSARVYSGPADTPMEMDRRTNGERPTPSLFIVRGGGRQQRRSRMHAKITSSSDVLVSHLLEHEPDMRDLVVEFVNELPARVDQMRVAYENLDWERLTRLAHQLKGAGGSYGYPQISGLAAEMEAQFRQHDAEDFPTWMQALTRLCEAARRGLSAG
jgi:HPt (histidine-containing phosphotransfer) domain-containing protein